MDIQQSYNGIHQSQDERLNDQILQLGIKINMTQPDVDREQIDGLLNHYLSYPSTEAAERHRDANKLGQLDADRQQKVRRISQQKMLPQQQYKQICGCCGFILQDQQLQICRQQFQNLNNIGISTFVYFRTIINLAVLLAIMFVVYSTYSIATNVKASQMDIDGNMSSTALKFLSISLGSKSIYGSDQKKNMYVIGAWIGCGMMLLWGGAFLGLKFYQKQSQIKILLQTKSVAQYSLLIEKMPTGLTKIQVQRQLNLYLKQIKQNEQVNIDEIKIEKYNQGKPFYFNEEEFNSQELKQVLKIYNQYKEIFIGWLLERRDKDRFGKTQKYRTRKYEEYGRVIARKQKICKEMVQHIKQEYKKMNKENKTTVFITFQTNRQKNFILDHNPSDLISRIKDYIPFIANKQRFTITKDQVQYPLHIFPAPDPQDIIWSNIGVTNCEKRTRKLLTFSITMIMLAISYVIVYSLSTVQVLNSQNKYLSLLISLSISVINLVIGQVIQLLTKYERDYSMTNFQTSLAIKSIAAQLVNCVFIPIMANYFIKNNIYEENGLIEDVFILGITNSFVAPIVKITDPYYYLRLLYCKFKMMPSEKIGMHQFELNQICQRLQFEVGYEYIYIVNLFLFTCFFVSLQPIIPVFALAGLGLMYWAQKYSLFKRCQRPVPGTKIINTTMSQLIYFGTIAYTLGSLTWANFLPNTQFKQALLPNLFALSAAVIVFLVPYQSIFRKIFKNKRMPQLNYADHRVFFTSEYDRLNPSTSEAGIRQYRKFLQLKRKQLQKQRPQVKQKLSLGLQLSNRPNFLKQPSNLFFSMHKDNSQAVINNLLNKQSQNILTPQMIATVLMPNELHKQKSILKTSKVSPKVNKYRNSLPKRYSAGTDLNLNAVIQQPTEQYWRNMDRIESADIQHGLKQSYLEKPCISQIQEERRGDQYLGEISRVKSYIVKEREDKENAHQNIGNQSPIQIDIRNTDQNIYREENNALKESIINKMQPIESRVKDNGTNKPISFITFQVSSKPRASLLLYQKSKERWQQRDQKQQNINVGQIDLQSRIKSSRGKRQISFRESMIHGFRESCNFHEQVSNRFSINAENILPICKDSEPGSDLGESQIKIYELGHFQ